MAQIVHCAISAFSFGKFLQCGYCFHKLNSIKCLYLLTFSLLLIYFNRFLFKHLFFSMRSLFLMNSFYEFSNLQHFLSLLSLEIFAFYQMFLTFSTVTTFIRFYFRVQGAIAHFLQLKLLFKYLAQYLFQFAFLKIDFFYASLHKLLKIQIHSRNVYFFY